MGGFGPPDVGLRRGVALPRISVDVVCQLVDEGEAAGRITSPVNDGPPQPVCEELPSFRDIDVLHHHGLPHIGLRHGRSRELESLARAWHTAAMAVFEFVL